MLDVAREYAEREGVGEQLLDLRVGDLRTPPVDERVPLVAIPFRSLLHMPDEAEKLRALEAAAAVCSSPAGGSSSTSSRRAATDIEETDGHLARAGAGNLRARRLGRARPARSSSP